MRNSQNPTEVCIIVHGVCVTVPNPRRLHKNKVFEQAVERYGRQIRLAS